MAKRVLLTGPNGYLGQHILSAFLKSGHSVRAVVRTESKAAQLRDTFRSYVDSERLDFGIVSDITVPGAFDAVLQSTPPFEVVVHSASPFNYRIGDFKNEDFLIPAVAGTTSILRSVVAVAPSVRRVVLTSSVASVADFAAPPVTSPARIYTEADWNPVTWEQGLNPQTSPKFIYQASKKYAELAAWDIAQGKDKVVTQKPAWDLAVLNPPMIYGPVFDPDSIPEPKALSQSTWSIYSSLLKPEGKASDPIPPTGLHLYVDVRDVALAHVRAAEVPAAGGKRFLLVAGGISNQRMANLLRKALPEMRERIPEGNPENDAMPEGIFGGDSSRAKEVLGMKFRSDEEMITDLAVQLRAIDARRTD